MIDIVPGASTAQTTASAGANAPSGQSGLSGSTPASNEPGTKTDSTSVAGAKNPASFADTLQEKLKLSALNKAAATVLPAPDGNLPTTVNQDIGASATPVQFVPAKADDPLATKDDKAHDEKADKAADSADSVSVASASPPPLPPPDPIALNTVNAIPVPVTQNSTATLPVNSSNVQDRAFQKPGESTSTASATSPSKAATLAVDQAKSDAIAANNDDKKNTGDTFQDALNNRLNSAESSPLNRSLPANVAPTVTRQVQVPLTSPHWATDVGNQLNWMAGNNQSRADLVLNPPQLGRIEVSITMNGDQATASFVSANPDVRDALQGSLPRLREVMADAGVFLGQASIGAGSFTQNQNGGEKGGKSPGDSFSSSGQSLLGSINRPLSMGPAQTIQGRGLIDLFA